MNVQPGDLAVIVYDDRPQNMGAIVLVGESATAALAVVLPQRIQEAWGQCWHVTAMKRPLACCRVSLMGMVETVQYESIALDRNLRRIEAHGQGREVTKDEELTA